MPRKAPTTTATPDNPQAIRPPDLGVLDVLSLLRGLSLETLNPAIEAAKKEHLEALGRYKQLMTLKRGITMRELGDAGRKAMRAKRAAEKDAQAKEESPDDDVASLAEQIETVLKTGPAKAAKIGLLIGFDVDDVESCLEESPDRFEKSMGVWRIRQ